MNDERLIPDGIIEVQRPRPYDDNWHGLQSVRRPRIDAPAFSVLPTLFAIFSLVGTFWGWAWLLAAQAAMHKPHFIDDPRYHQQIALITGVWVASELVTLGLLITAFCFWNRHHIVGRVFMITAAVLQVLQCLESMVPVFVRPWPPMGL